MGFLRIWVLVSLSFLLPLVSTAGLRDFLSEQAYNLLHKEDCPPISTMQLRHVEAICRAGIGALPGGINPDDIQNLTEILFFAQSQRQLIEDLKCEHSKLEGLQKDITPLQSDLKLKLPMIKFLKKEAQQRINRWQLLQGQIPHNPNIKLNSKYQKIKDEADKLNSEAQQMLKQSEAIILSLPFGGYPEIHELVDDLDESDLSKEIELIAQINKSLQSANKSFSKDIAKLKSSISKDGEVSRSLKERIMQDPDFFNHMRRKLSLNEKSYDGFFCKLDAKYGQGTEIAETTLTVGSAFLGLGAFGYLGRILKMGSTAKKSNTVMALEKAGAVTTLAATSADIIHQIEKECLPMSQNKMTVKKAGASCTAAELVRTLSEGNCALSIALPSLGFGAAALLGNTRLADDFLKNLKGAKSSAAKSSVAQKAEEPELVYEWVNGKFVKKGEGPKIAQVPDHLVTQHHYQNYVNLRRQGKIVEAEKYERKILNILSSEKIDEKTDSVHSAGVGIGGAKFIRFSDGTMGVWKPKNLPKLIDTTTDKTHAASYLDNGSAEIAAYNIDKFLGFNRVPPTVSRSFRGEEGTVQLMVGNLDQKFHLPNPHETRMFDYLIANDDRHLNNYLITKEGHVVAIDNGLSLKAAPNEWDGEYYVLNMKKVIQKYEAAMLENKKIWNSATSQKNLAAIRNDTVQTLSALVGERRVYDKLKSTSEVEWRKLLKPNLNNTQIAEFLKRRNEIIKAVEEARRKLGENIFREGPASPAVRIFQRSNK